MFPREVVLAIVILDLPIILNEKSSVLLKEGFGASWWYLNCDCDDFYVDVVEDVLSLCSFTQVRTMCFINRHDIRSDSITDKSSTITLLSRATPKCRAALEASLRFVGQYEFIDSIPVENHSSIGLQIFDAIDYGTSDYPIPNGKRVQLSCYSNYETFLDEVCSKAGMYFFFHVFLVLTYFTSFVDSISYSSCSRIGIRWGDSNVYGRKWLLGSIKPE